MDRDQKATAVAELADRLREAEAIFAVDYRGISVTQAAELRSKLSEADAVFKVVKNRLAKRAAADAGTEGVDDWLEGPTALTLIKGDAVIAAKAISNFTRQHEVLEFKGGIMDGEPLDPEGFSAIARLPALEVLHGQLVGVTASPLTGLIRGLGSMMSGLAIALGQIAEQGLVEGEEPAPEPPAEEAAPEPPAEEPADEPSDDEPAEEAATPEPPAETEPEAAGPSDEAEASAEPAEPDPAGTSDEVADAEAEPAAPPEPEPAGNGAEGEASGGDEISDTNDEEEQ